MIAKSEDIKTGEKPDLMKIFELIKSLKKEGFVNLDKSYVTKSVNEIGAEMLPKTQFFKVEKDIANYLDLINGKVYHQILIKISKNIY